MHITTGRRHPARQRQLHADRSTAGRGLIAGRQLHTAHYRRASDFIDQRVLIVGGGNSAAQILAEVSLVAETAWATLRPPRFLPDDVDGRTLFEIATKRHRARQLGERDTGGVSGLGDPHRRWSHRP